ncbi:MAG: GNAT family N-acetyltransferase [Candidatus Izemoplasmatales bacterium]|nr:GNAT family N-acetyltransferase [Candidatus Izemoplasmatales bacterium]MDY0138654.1 GNAT family N-acetyltransferase [Candidatus Izemoplasmatales bacterium]
MKLIFIHHFLGKVDSILKNWNEEFKDSFPITEELFNTKIIDSKYTLINESICLFENKDYVGTIIFKALDDDLYISFVHITKEKRFKGYGKLLINKAIELAKKYNYKKIILGSDPDCLFSGVFMEGNDEVHRFFSNQGFTREYLNYNLIAYKPPEPIWLDDEYKIKKAEETNEVELLSFIENNFSSRWLKEVKENTLEQVYLLFYKNRIIGFINSAISKNHHYPNSLNLYELFENLAGIGPLGIAPEFQSLGLGKGFVNFVIRDLFRLGASEVMVDWTGLIEFYKKCGFNKIYKTYIIYSMKVGKENEE